LFLKVFESLYIEALHCKHTRALTFEKLCPGLLLEQRAAVTNSSKALTCESLWQAIFYNSSSVVVRHLLRAGAGIRPKPYEAYDLNPKPLARLRWY
jgi:hypothetical protein